MKCNACWKVIYRWNQLGGKEIAFWNKKKGKEYKSTYLCLSCHGALRKEMELAGVKLELI